MPQFESGCFVVRDARASTLGHQRRHQTETPPRVGNVFLSEGAASQRSRTLRLETIHLVVEKQV